MIRFTLFYVLSIHNVQNQNSKYDTLKLPSSEIINYSRLRHLSFASSWNGYKSTW